MIFNKIFNKRLNREVDKRFLIHTESVVHEILEEFNHSKIAILNKAGPKQIMVLRDVLLYYRSQDKQIIVFDETADEFKYITSLYEKEGFIYTTSFSEFDRALQRYPNTVVFIFCHYDYLFSELTRSSGLRNRLQNRIVIAYTRHSHLLNYDINDDSMQNWLVFSDAFHNFLDEDQFNDNNKDRIDCYHKGKRYSADYADVPYDFDVFG